MEFINRVLIMFFPNQARPICTDRLLEFDFDFQLFIYYFVKYVLI